MFWLISMLVTAGAGGMALVAAMNRLGGDALRVIRGARELTPESFAEGLHGRLTGIVEAVEPPHPAPGQPDRPCLFYQLIVYELANQQGAGEVSRVVHRSRVDGELEIVVGRARVRAHTRDIQIVDGPSYDVDADLREVPSFGSFTSHVNYVSPGTQVQLVGTLAREVDADPSAQSDYREVATRYRLIRTRAQPILLAAKRS